jgi:GGDEF domain-containing protein
MDKKKFIIILSFLVVPGIGLLDQVSGDDLSLIALYLVPIALASWQGGLLWGSAVAVLASASWAIANFAFPVHIDLDPAFQHSWEFIEKAIFFALAVAVTSRLRALVDAEKDKGLRDFATGLPNRRAFAADLAAAQAGQGPVAVGFIELDGLEGLYLERGEAFVEALFKAAAGLARAAAPTYRFGDERLAFIVGGESAAGLGNEMKKLASRIEEELLRPRGLSLALKIGIARCRDAKAVPSPALRKFLEGSMIFLRGKPGTQVEEFEFTESR